MQADFGIRLLGDRVGTAKNAKFQRDSGGNTTKLQSQEKSCCLSDFVLLRKDVKKERNVVGTVARKQCDPAAL